MDRVPARPVIASRPNSPCRGNPAHPGLWLAGSLSLSRLDLLVAVIGLAEVFFETAWGIALRRMVGDGRLLAAYSRRESVRSATSVGGPGVAGLLIRAVGLVVALLVDDELSGQRRHGLGEISRTVRRRSATSPVSLGSRHPCWAHGDRPDADVAGDGVPGHDLELRYRRHPGTVQLYALRVLGLGPAASAGRS